MGRQFLSPSFHGHHRTHTFRPRQPGRDTPNRHGQNQVKKTESPYWKYGENYIPAHASEASKKRLSWRSKSKTTALPAHDLHRFWKTVDGKENVGCWPPQSALQEPKSCPFSTRPGQILCYIYIVLQVGEWAPIAWNLLKPCWSCICSIFFITTILGLGIIWHGRRQSCCWTWSGMDNEFPLNLHLSLDLRFYLQVGLDIRVQFDLLRLGPWWRCIGGYHLEIQN